MPAHLINASNRINANTAGQTRRGSDVSMTPVATTAGEASTSLVGGELDSMLAGGVHPETVPMVTPTPLEKPTNSIRGVLGGLKPAAGSVLSPGPTGSTATARTIQAGTEGVTKAANAGRTAATSLVARLRGKK